jgi:hypothetical protein
VVVGIVQIWRGVQYLKNRSQSDILLDEAAALEKRNPVAAEHMLHQGLSLGAAEERRKIEQLRSRARKDAQAARELASLLQERLKLRAAAKYDFETNMAGDPRLPTVLQNLEEANVETRNLLEEVNSNLRRLNP